LFPSDVFKKSRFPPDVYKSNESISLFGLVTEYLIRTMLTDIPGMKIMMSDGTQLSKNTIDSAYPLAMTEASKMLNIKTENWKSLMPYWGALQRDLLAIWPIKYVNNLTCDAEISVPFDDVNFSGHPDFMNSNVILDVKTTSNFTSMQNHACLQILSYYAIAKSMGRNIQYVGLILPVQKSVALFDLSLWTNWVEFLSIIHEQIKVSLIFAINMKSHPLIGSHFQRHGEITGSLMQWFVFRGNRPVQMFISAPQRGTPITFSDSDLQSAQDLIGKTGIRYFTHAPYTLNMSNLDNQEFIKMVLSHELKITNRIGGYGVVVHVGKSLKLSVKQALQNMEELVRSVLSYANERCCLMLETPAGQGTELCTTIDSLIDFYQRFTADEQKVFKICIDTCHVFATGYDPDVYLQQWIDRVSPQSVHLIHFNDSKEACGSRKDRHAGPGTGHVGSQKLSNVISIAEKYNIPMVIE
jgi:deoxyribonuclease-4